MSGATRRASTPQTEAARRLDAAIDDLLAGRIPDPGLAEDSIERTAFVLGWGLPRLHPRFGFEERLARRLRGEAAGADLGSDEPSTVVPFPGTQGADDPAATAGPWHPGRRSAIGAIGAIASAASVLVTVAGAAFVIWRRARDVDPSEGLV